MTNLTTQVKAKSPEREEIAADIAEFMRNSGKIEKVKSDVRGHKPDKKAFSIGGIGMA